MNIEVQIHTGTITAPTTLFVPDPTCYALPPSPAQRIAEAVCRQFELSVKDLMSSRRPDWIAWPRQIAMALAYEHTDMSTTEVAYYFRRLDHSTVLHAFHKVKNRVETDKKAREQVRKLEEAIQRV